jgi:NADPH:quinone reductase-like Zn-dependent oxidoreductase
MWASGDFSVIAALIHIVAEELVDSVDPAAGSRMLDVAGGTGNAAIAAARCNCQVTCTDYVPALLDRGRERVAAIAGEDGVRKAIDSVGGRLGGHVSRSLRPGGEMIVYGALSTHRQTEPDELALDARSMIYGTKTVRGFRALPLVPVHTARQGQRGPGADIRTRRRRHDPDP